MRVVQIYIKTLTSKYPFEKLKYVNTVFEFEQEEIDEIVRIGILSPKVIEKEEREYVGDLRGWPS